LIEPPGPGFNRRRLLLLPMTRGCRFGADTDGR